MKVIFLRHGKTAGNIQKLYNGSTDDPLCDEGIKEIAGYIDESWYPKVDFAYISPLLRCRQTKGMIYPGVPDKIVSDLRECNFGRLEGKNHQLLKEVLWYQQWLESQKEVISYPGGEKVQYFKVRCQDAFSYCLKDAFSKGYESIAVVAHGGTIMAVMEAYAYPQRKFHEWVVGNACGYQLVLEQKDWERQRRFMDLKLIGHEIERYAR
ncbi:histidine phosphatase family protein [Youxingia wuxianensis]|uniref:Histidine phosphatase family protein n=1 Tax=Youxingia wuxianensis TaxID=2763678 RepID=A0A926ERR4_9FIRM|nr:histidine phosphatase family protein [Youxingia wuxianensis]MBC8585085.1 histidine phosphatase family protein [Youxingia wuxianensis]